MEQIGDRIAALLRLRGMTQKQLARACGIEEATVCRYIKNEREPRLQVTAQMAMILGTTTDYLICGVEDNVTFDDAHQLLCRNALALTDDEKFKLIELIVKKRKKY